LTRDRFDVLLRHCADLDLEVEWTDLGSHRRGCYLDDLHLIKLNERMTRQQATATLAHECGHAIFGDRCTTPFNERRAWELGAALIITAREYAEAEELVGPHAGALANELEVTPRVIHAWRRWFHKRYPVEVRRRGLGVDVSTHEPDSGGLDLA